MPGWQPNWTDVVWDQGAADAASTALDQMAYSFEFSANDRYLLAQEDTLGWYGEHRNSFDRYLDEVLRIAQGLAQECRDAAARVRQINQQVLDDQAQRERDRQRWKDEQAEEEARQRGR